MFGSKSTFGTPTTTPFGATTTSSLFSQNRPVGVSFGQPQRQPTTGGLFGSGTTATPTSGSIFGATPVSTSGGFLMGGTAGSFGQPSTSGGLFGSTPTTKSNLFGGTSTSGSLFGPTSTPAGTSLFGSGTTGTGSLFASATAPSGTTIKFDPPINQDTMMKNNIQTSIQTKHVCVTAMKAYEAKSLEELRVEDYLANRKGPGLGTAAPGTGFTFGSQPAAAAPAPSGTLFGASAASTAPSLFGTQTKSMFGTAPATSSTPGGLFGQPAATQSGGLFGGQKSLFSASNTTAASTGFSFTSTPFSTTTTTSTGGLFGPKTATGGLFAPAAGQSAFGQTGTFGFGQNTAQKQPGTGPFGTSAGAFGTAPASSGTGFQFTSTGTTGFGTGGLFAAKPTTTTAPAFGGFQTQTSSAFGQTGGGLFSNTSQPKPATGFFGAPAGTGAGVFGAPSAAPTLGAGGGFFGTQPKSGAFAFGGPSNTGGIGTTPAFNFAGMGSGTTGAGAPTALTIGTDPARAAAEQAIMQNQVLGMAASPYRDYPFAKLLGQKKDGSVPSPTDPIAQSRVLQGSAQKQSITSPSFVSRISARPLSMPTPSPRLMTAFNRSATLTSPIGASSSFSSQPRTMIQEGIQLRRNVKKLTIPVKGGSQKKVSRERERELVTSESDFFLPEQDAVTRGGRHSSLNNTWSVPGHRAVTENKGVPQLDLSASDFRPPSSATGDRSGNVRPTQFAEYSNPVYAPVARKPRPSDVVDIEAEQGVGESRSTDGARSTELSPGTYSEVVDKTAADNWTTVEKAEEPLETHPAGIKLNRSDYYTIPSLEDLKDLVDTEGECWVKGGFTVGRLGYGSVFWPDPVNVAGLDLDQLVHFRHKEVTVYPDDENKPENGNELNRRAEVTLERIWPNDKTTHTPVKDVNRLIAMKFRERLEKACIRMEAEFVDYRPDSGSWVFKVAHFTKYGLDEDSEEERPKVEKAILGQEGAVQAVLQRQPIHTSPTKTKTLDSEQRIVTVRKSGILEDKQSKDLLEDDSDMLDIAQEPVPLGFNDTMELEDSDSEMYPSREDYRDLIGSVKQSVEQLKASFFDMSDNDEGSDSEWSPLTDEPVVVSKTESLTKRLKSLRDVFDKSDSLLLGVSPITTSQKHVGDDGDESEMIPESVLVPERAMIKEKNPIRLLPYGDSLLSNRWKYWPDGSCFHNRRFRVGWGPGKTLFRLESPQEVIRNTRDHTVPVSLMFPTESFVKNLGFTLRLLKASGSDASSREKILGELLDYQISCSMLDESEDTCPKISPAASDDLVEGYCSLTENGDSDEHMVWKLCSALWGSAKKFPKRCETNEYAMEAVRKKRLSQWITVSSKQAVEESIQETKGSLISQRKPLTTFLRLTNGEITEAANEAMEAGDLRLCLLLTQSGHCPQSRDLCLEQLSQWFQCGADVYVDETRMKQFALMAGRPLWKMSNGHVLNTCNDVDWKRALGIQLWYGCEQDASISDVVEEYERSWRGEGAFAPPPFPPYRLLNRSGDCENPDETWKLDISYHLLKLFCDRSYPMETVLNPQTYSHDHTDYHLSWHLWCFLSSIGYSHLSEDRENDLHSGYAEQLCANGLFPYAPFVLMHIKDPNIRAQCVKKVIANHAGDLTAERTEFLIEKLKVPMQWIAEGKCLWARVTGNKEEEALFAAQAGGLNLAHRIFVSEVGPSSVVNGDLETLKKFLNLLSPNSDDIQGWAVGGEIFGEFLLILNCIRRIQKADTSVTAIRDLKPNLLSLVSRLPGMKSDTPLQRLCQGEIGKKVSHLLRLILSKEEQKSVGPAILDLPMPDDYKLEEIQRLVQLCMEFVDEDN